MSKSESLWDYSRLPLKSDREVLRRSEGAGAVCVRGVCVRLPVFLSVHVCLCVFVCVHVCLCARVLCVCLCLLCVCICVYMSGRKKDYEGSCKCTGEGNVVSQITNQYAH